MNDIDIRFFLININKLKDYFRKLKLNSVCDYLEYMKMLAVSQDKELKRIKNQLWNSRKEIIRLKSLERVWKGSHILTNNKK
jgi:hypothetical protein